MTDDYKTQAQLLAELEALRQRIRELTAGSSEPSQACQASGDSEDRQSQRSELQTEIEFIGDFDVVQATGVDISRDGICFEVSDPLPIEMQFRFNGETHQHRTHLIWVKPLPDGRYRFGLRFVSSEPYPVV